MASANKKKSGKAVSIFALTMAVAIPVAGLIYGQVSAREEEETRLEQRKKFDTIWRNVYRSSGETNEQLQTEQMLADRQWAATVAIQETIPGIICWGDTLTDGIGGSGVSYPSALCQQISSDLNASFARLYPDEFETDEVYNLSIPVVNMGVAGESSLTVAGRNGAIPYVVSEDFTIPEDTATRVRVHFTSENGEVVEPLVRGSRGMGSVTIGGVEGVLEIRQAYGESVRYAYYFTRTEEGDAVKVSAGTPIVTAGSQVYKDYVAVIQLGHNGGWTDADDLVAQINAIVEAQSDPDRYIVLGLAFGDAEQIQQVNAALENAFGEHFIDLWNYMRGEGLTRAGIEPSTEDIEAMADGLMPESFTGGANFFNAAGYNAVASALKKKVNELGYLDAVNAVLEAG